MKTYEVDVYDSGTKVWYLNGLLHREDGPAIEWSDGTKWWYLNGKELTEQEHRLATTKKSCSGKTVIVDGVEYVLTKKET